MAATGLVRDYKGKFDPLVYLQTFYGDVSSQEDLMPFLYRGLHSAFCNGDVRGQRLLDIGTGPSICSVISAAPHFREIFLSDYSAPNRVYLDNWLHGTSPHSFRNVIRYFLDLEKTGVSSEAREAEVRGKVKDIMRCDLLELNPFSDYAGPPFDAVTSSLCIEAAATDVNSYSDICTKVASVLKPGGHLVLAGVLEQTFYCTCGEKFYTLDIGKGDLLSAWKDAGFTVTSWTDQKAPPAESNPFSDYGAGFVLVAMKDN